MNLRRVLGASIVVMLVVVLIMSIFPGVTMALREKIGIDSRDDCYLYNGADLYIYSDDHSTQKAHIDGATGAIDTEGGIDIPINIENIMSPSVLSVPITWTAAAGGTGTVATIGAGEVWIVHDVLIETTTNFDCTGDDVTLVVGDGNDADGFLVLTDADLQATVTEGTGFSAGWIGQDDDNTGVYLDETEYGFVYDEATAETIDWLLDETSGETITAGAATIYVFYTRID